MPEAFDPYHRWLGIPANERPAHQRVTVAMNGKRIIEDATLVGPTSNKDALSVQDGDPGPIMLQCYAGGTVRFRNISIKRIGD